MVIGDITDCRLPSLLATALTEQWLPNCLQMIYVCPRPAFPTVAVYHWHILTRPGWRLAEDQSGQRGVGSSMTVLPFLGFCHLICFSSADT